MSALIGVPDRRSLHEPDRVGKVVLVRQEVADGVPLGHHVILAGNRHAFVLQRGDERRVGYANPRGGCGGSHASGWRRDRSTG